MSEPRLMELVSEYLDGANSQAVTGELASLLEVSVENRATFEKHVLIAELAAQHYAATRSETSFVEGFETRLRSTADETDFVNGLADLLDAESQQPPERQVKRRKTRIIRRRSTRPHTPAAHPHSNVVVWPLRLAAIAAGLLILFGALFQIQWSHIRPLPGPALAARAATLRNVRGNVIVARAAERVRAGSGQTVVRPGQTVLTSDEHSSVDLAYADGSTLSLGGSTTLRLVEAGKHSQKRLFLEQGHVLGSVLAQPGDHPMVLETRFALAEILGTRFDVRAEHDTTRFNVIDGAVRVQNKTDGASLILQAGYQTVVARSMRVSVHPGFNGRTTNGLLAMYTFQEGAGTVIHDISSAVPALNLRIRNSGAVRWLTDNGLQFVTPTMAVSETPAQRIIDACKQNDAVTVEAWIRPAAVQAYPNQPQRIVTLSRDADFRDFTVEQVKEGFRVRLRTTTTNLSGSPNVRTPFRHPAAEPLHLVCTRSVRSEVRFFVNGRQTARKHRAAGDLSTWADALYLGLGDEFTGGRAWLGTYYLVAVYDRALPAREIQANHAAGLPSPPPASASTR